MSTERDEPVEDQPMSDAGVTEQRDLVEPVAVGPGDPAVHARPAQPPDGDAPAGHDGAAGSSTPAGSAALAAAQDPADAELLALIDRLAVVLERSDLGELEVSAGGTTIILRSPSAIERPTVLAAASAGTGAEAAASGGGSVAAPPAPAAAKPSVKAPLTGIFYGAPSPGATPYVSVGDHLAVGQVIGLIEAMKLFNEIKSDLAGRVARVCADSGQLVKARQPLIEVERA